MRRIFNAFLPASLLLLSVSFPVIAEQQYIGLRSIPPNFVVQRGWLISNSSYAIGEIVEASCKVRPCPQGTKQMLWLQKFIRYDSAGKPTYEVVDVINLPSGYEKDFENQIFDVCSLNGEIQGDIFAIAKFESDKDVMTDIQKAWRVNRELEKIEEISTDSVTCINPAGANYSG